MIESQMFTLIRWERFKITNKMLITPHFSYLVNFIT